MKNLFRGYIDFDEGEIDKVWREGIFVFDTNILLNLYRYSNETRDIFIKVLEKIKDQIWIPNQVATEYFKNRFIVINNQNKLYSTILKDIGFEKIKSDIGKYKDRHSSIDIGEILDIIKEMEKKVKEILDESQKDDNNYLRKDKICDKITNLFDGKVGAPYSDDQLNGLYKIAEERFAKEVPPGFKDEKKGIPDKYNDFILWRQILDYAEESKKDIILITEDKKDDWWLSIDGKTISPRPELIQEIYCIANTSCLIYKANSFLTLAKEKLYINDANDALEVEKAIDEVEYFHEFEDYEEESFNEFQYFNELDVVLSNISQFCINGLREYGLSVSDIIDHIKDINDKGVYEFTTADIVRRFNNGIYIVGDPLNKIIGTILSRIKNNMPSLCLFDYKRSDVLDDNGKHTTVASWYIFPS